LKKLYISTKNKNKLKELSRMLGDDIELLHPGEDDEDVEETGVTLWENALLKANVGFERSGVPTIADDTGIEVDALNGGPGVYSARYAGEDATYEDNCRKLLQEMKGVAEEQRGARFRTVIAYVDGQSEPRRFDGIVEGRIITSNRGEGGFGYDPVFEVEGTEKTMAEMGSDEKNAISHRGNALRAFVKWWEENKG